MEARERVLVHRWVNSCNVGHRRYSFTGEWTFFTLPCRTGEKSSKGSVWLPMWWGIMKNGCTCNPLTLGNAFVSVRMHVSGWSPVFSWGTLQQHQHHSCELTLYPNWLSFSLHHNAVFYRFIQSWLRLHKYTVVAFLLFHIYVPTFGQATSPHSDHISNCTSASVKK